LAQALLPGGLKRVVFLRRLMWAALAVFIAASAPLCSTAPAARVVAIADLHGDFDHAVAILRAAGLVDDVQSRSSDPQQPSSRYESSRWTGGNTTLVQTGDMVDRGTYAIDLYKLFADLRRQAPLSGGQVINLIGNHDLMNLIGDLRYVSQGDINVFGGSRKRKAAFAADGWLGRQILEEFSTAAVVAETVFVHAGLLPKHVENGLDALNAEVRDKIHATISGRSRIVDTSLLQNSGPFWLRRMALGSESQICPIVRQVLKQVGARRIVFGHSQVEDGTVRPRCGGRVLMADTIISKDGYPMCWEPGSWDHQGCKGSLSYVEILGSDAFAVSAEGDTKLGRGVWPGTPKHIPIEGNTEL